VVVGVSDLEDHGNESRKSFLPKIVADVELER